MGQEHNWTFTWHRWSRVRVRSRTQPRTLHSASPTGCRCHAHSQECGWDSLLPACFKAQFRQPASQTLLGGASLRHPPFPPRAARAHRCPNSPAGWWRAASLAGGAVGSCPCCWAWPSSWVSSHWQAGAGWSLSRSPTCTKRLCGRAARGASRTSTGTVNLSWTMVSGEPACPSGTLSSDGCSSGEIRLETFVQHALAKRRLSALLWWCSCCLGWGFPGQNQCYFRALMNKKTGPQTALGIFPIRSKEQGLLFIFFYN